MNTSMERIKRDWPTALVGFSAYSTVKLGLELAGVVETALNPFDVFSILTVGITYHLQKQVPLSPLLALAPSMILISFIHDLFCVGLGVDGLAGYVGLGMSLVIGICSYFILVTLKKASETKGGSPIEEAGKYPVFLDAERKYLSAPLEKCDGGRSKSVTPPAFHEPYGSWS